MRMTVANALAQIPADRRWATVFARGTLEVEIYAPRGSDPQTPHRKDELYVVVTGSALSSRMISARRSGRAIVCLPW